MKDIVIESKKKNYLRFHYGVQIISLLFLLLFAFFYYTDFLGCLLILLVSLLFYFHHFNKWKTRYDSIYILLQKDRIVFSTYQFKYKPKNDFRFYLYELKFNNRYKVLGKYNLKVQEIKYSEIVKIEFTTVLKISLKNKKVLRINTDFFTKKSLQEVAQVANKFINK